MFLRDENIAWMHKFGVTHMALDPEGNVLEITVLPWVTNSVTGQPEPFLAAPQAPIPPTPKEMTPEQIRIARAKMRRAEFEENERMLYAAVGGSPFEDARENGIDE